MMLLQNVTDAKTSRQVSITHSTSDGGKEHTISIYEPVPGQMLGGKLIAQYKLTAGQARELKAHL